MTYPSYPKLPEVKGAEIEAVAGYLKEKFNSTRPPTVAAAICVLAVLLDEKGKTFPQRKPTAEHLGATLGGVDHAITTAISRGLLSRKVDLVPGKCARRESLKQDWYLVPDPALVEVVAQTRARRPARRGSHAA